MIATSGTETPFALDAAEDNQRILEANSHHRKTAIVEPAWQGFGVEVYVTVGAIYFVFCFAMSKYSQGLEAELNRHRVR